MRLARPFQVLAPSGPFAELDGHRAWRPSVLRREGAVVRMWYGGHDGSISRVLSAEQRPREGWVRLGINIDAGLAGPSDSGGADSPSVVRTSAGFVMAYAGSDGTVTRVHLARSVDGRHWQPHGPIAALAGNAHADSPCLVVAQGHLWLYYAGRGRDGRTAVLAATTADGTTWREVGPVLEPGPDEAGLCEPWVVARDEDCLMCFVQDAGSRGASVEIATSSNGRDWSRHPIPLGLSRRHHDAGPISGPSMARLDGKHLCMWYAAGAEADTSGGCRLWSADIIGGVP